MARGSRKQRKRVAKALSKVFRKLEVGPAPEQRPSQRIPNGRSGAAPPPPPRRASLRRPPPTVARPQTGGSNHNSRAPSEANDFALEQASLRERCRGAGPGHGRTAQRRPGPAIELQAPVFTLAPTEETIESGIAALGGIGESSGYMNNSVGRAATSFLVQQAQRQRADREAAHRRNRFAALSEPDADPAQSSQTEQHTPTSTHAGEPPAFQFPPPLLQVSRPRWSGTPQPPPLASLDGLDV